MVFVDPDDTLYEACLRLRDHDIHRLLVADRSNGGALYILTHKRILHFLLLLVRYIMYRVRIVKI